MTQIQKKVATVVATSALMLNAFTSFAFADTTIEILKNGSSSVNTAAVTTTQTTTVVQSNTASVNNNVSGNASTGGNKANDNTAGDVTIKTGAATSDANVSTTVNSNKADVNCCNKGDTNVLIAGNGSSSVNTATLDKTNDINVFQSNAAWVNNKVDTNAKTGDNEANRNTGGDVMIKTGSAKADANVSTTANRNSVVVGGGSGGGSSVDLRIVGNGTGSVNTIGLTLDRSILLVQSNSAWVNNNVSATAKTGDNEANDNTGGNVTVKTGNAGASANVDNHVNFNMASVDCDCLGDILAKVAGNGSSTVNTIKAALDSSLEVFQGCENKPLDGPLDDPDGHFRVCAWLNNNADATAKTGENKAKRNTGPVSGDDVEIMTGDATTSTMVKNSGNVNVFGPGAGAGLDLSGFHFDFHFGTDDLLSLLHLLGLV